MSEQKCSKCERLIYELETAIRANDSLTGTVAKQDAEIERRDDLIRHIWVHAAMKYTIGQMTSEQHELYESIIEQQIKKIENEPSDAGGKE